MVAKTTSSATQSQGIFTIPPPFWDFAEAGDDTSLYNMTVCSSALNHNPRYQTTPTIITIISCSDYFIDSSITRDLFTPFARPTLFRGSRWQGQRYLEIRHMPYFQDAELGHFFAFLGFCHGFIANKTSTISISRTFEQPMTPYGSIYIPRSHSAIHPHVETSAARPRSWMRSIHVEYHLPGSLTTNSFEPLVTRLEAVWVLKFRFNAPSQTVDFHDTLLNNLLIRVMYISKGDGSCGSTYPGHVA